MYGMPSARGGRTLPTSPATTMIVTRYGVISSRVDWMGTFSVDRIDSSWVEKPNSSAAATAPSGEYRPKMTAARAIYPSPDDMPLANEPARAARQVGAADAGQQAGHDHVAVPGGVHPDADRVRRDRVLADRPGAQPPAGGEQAHLHQGHGQVRQAHGE